MEGRRVEGETRFLERPGDYLLVYQPDGTTIKWLWFALPNNGQWGRIAALGGGDGEEPEWTITEDDEGRVTVEPSIDTGVMMVDGVDCSWHGHLRGGVWT